MNTIKDMNWLFGNITAPEDVKPLEFEEISKSTIWYRINKLGWDEDRAKTTPVRKISKPCTKIEKRKKNTLKVRKWREQKRLSKELKSLEDTGYTSV